MELIINYKKGIKTKHALLLSDHQFSVGSDCPLSREEIKSMTETFENDIYININRLMFDDDLESLYQYLKWLSSLSIAGIYFSDMAVFMLAKDLDMLDLLIYAPGMTLVNREDVATYLELGIKGVELANELTLEEKTDIMLHNPNQVGAVISGYLMSSMSRREFLTNYFKHLGREEKIKEQYNLSLVENTRKGKMPIYEDQHGTYIYSEYILDSFAALKALKKAKAGLLRIDPIFLEVDVANDLILATESTLDSGQADLISLKMREKYPNLPFSIGFYDTETNMVKE